MITDAQSIVKLNRNLADKPARTEAEKVAKMCKKIMADIAAGPKSCLQVNIGKVISKVES